MGGNLTFSTPMQHIYIWDFPFVITAIDVDSSAVGDKWFKSLVIQYSSYPIGNVYTQGLKSFAFFFMK